MGKRIVKNYPSPRLMVTIGATNQQPAEAIGELVANSFDARNGDEKLSIIVDMRDDKIVVIDDGRGMTSEVLEKAVCIAEDMSKHIERGDSIKGHFGMGFKTSCSTLGEFFEIYTRPIDEKKEYHVEFDINEYSDRPSGADAWDVVIEDNPKGKSGVLGAANHGTAFIIKNLRDSNISIGSVFEYLGEAFKGHLETGDSIVVIDSSGEHQAKPKTYHFIPGTKIDINHEVCDGKYTITGWMALDKQTHNNGMYGFNIYRHNQLVEKWDQTWFPAHLMTSRIIGEVNMDFLDATFYKQGVQQSEIWNQVAADMKTYLSGIVTASRKVSQKHNIDKPAVLKQIVADLREDYNLPPDEGYTPDEPQGGGKNANPDKPATVTQVIKTVVQEQSLILDTGETINICYLEKESLGNTTAPFDYILDEDEEDDGLMELQVVVYTSHKLWEKKIHPEVQKILATSDAIYRMLVEKLGVDTHKALTIRNEWIDTRLSEGRE